MTELKAIPDPSSLQALLAELPANLLAGRRVLVTGGARGLGLAFAQCIAAAGASVVLADILGELAETEAKALREAGHTAHALPVDLSNPGSIVACADEAIRLLGGLDGLVNNAANYQFGRPRRAPARNRHVGPRDERQRARQLAHGPRLPQRAGRKRPRRHRQPRVRHGAVGRAQPAGLRIEQGRRHFHDALAGARVGRRQHHRQRRRARPHAGRGYRIRADGAPPRSTSKAAPFPASSKPPTCAARPCSCFPASHAS